MVKVKNGKLDINRVMYKDIKKYDREQMNDFLQEIYESGARSGYEKGLQGASKGLSEEEAEELVRKTTQEIAGVKGVGLTRLLEIKKILQKHLKELVQHEPKQDN